MRDALQIYQRKPVNSQKQHGTVIPKQYNPKHTQSAV